MSDRKLGRGLDFLIKRNATPDEAVPPGDRVVPVADIVPNPYQPRRNFDIDGLNELIESIRVHGVLQPIAVRPREDKYELISGERRWRAANELGLEQIPAVVHDVDDQEMLELALIENIQREDLDPIEKARAYQRLISEFDLTQEEAGKRLAQKRSTVANFLRLLDLPDDIQGMVARSEISMGHARALLAFEGAAEKLRLAREASQGRHTVRDLERLASARKAGPTSPGPRPASRSALAPHLDNVARRMRDVLGNKVVITGDKKRGRITIDYYGTDDLNRILDLVESRRASSQGA